MATYSFLLPSREAKFCDVLSYVFKLGCGMAEKEFRHTEINRNQADLQKQ
jgi:hypothetical protein